MTPRDLEAATQGAGVLEFHIVPKPQEIGNYRKYVEQLQQDGPRVHAGDEARWYETDRPQHSGEAVRYHNKDYVLAYYHP